MSFSYENQGGSAFLVYTTGGDEQFDSMSAGVLANNNIPGLIRPVFTQAGAGGSIRYNVSSTVSVQQFLSGPVNKIRLLSVFHGITDAMLSVGQFRLDPDMMVVNTNFMFVDVSTGRTMLICLPIIRQPRRGIDFCAFFKHIMFTTQFDQAEDYDYVARIINYLSSTPSFSLTQFKGLLTEISAEAGPVPSAMGNQGYPQGFYAVRPEQAQPQVQRGPVPGVPPVPPTAPAPAASAIPPTAPAPAASTIPPTPPVSAASTIPPTPPVSAVSAIPPTAPASAASAIPPTAPASAIPPTPPAPAGAPPAQPGAPAAPGGQQQVQTPGAGGNFGDTAPLDQGQPDRQIAPHLLRTRSGDKIPVTKPVFRIGRDMDYNDYPIMDNIYISHGHCHIVSRDGAYFVVDDKSKNHTYVDGMQIPPGQEVRLTHGCKLRIANEDFEFMLH